MALFVEHDQVFDFISSSQFLGFHMMDLHLAVTINELVANHTKRCSALLDFLLLPAPISGQKRIVLFTLQEVGFVFLYKGVQIQYQLVSSNLHSFDIEQLHIFAPPGFPKEDPVSSTHCIEIFMPNCFLSNFRSGFLLGPVPDFHPLIPVLVFETFACYHAIVIVGPSSKHRIQFHDEKTSSVAIGLAKQFLDTQFDFLNGFCAGFNQHFKASSIPSWPWILLEVIP
jgi:hypothetical protein